MGVIFLPVDISAVIEEWLNHRIANAVLFVWHLWVIIVSVAEMVLFLKLYNLHLSFHQDVIFGTFELGVCLLQLDFGVQLKEGLMHSCSI